MFAFIFLCLYLFIFLFIDLFVYLFIYVFFHLFISVCIYSLLGLHRCVCVCACNCVYTSLTDWVIFVCSPQILSMASIP